MELIKSKFAQIDNRNKQIILLNEPPSTNGLETTIENVSITIEENTILTISGNAWHWGLVFDKTPLNEIEGNVVKHHLKFRYEGISDFFNRIKKPYVSGWYRYEDNKPFNAKFSQWSLYYA